MTGWMQRLFGRRHDTPDLPGQVRDALALGTREQVLACAVDDFADSYVVATTWRLVQIRPEGAVILDRPWRDVDAAAWEPTTRTCSVTWVDGGRGAQWTFGDAEPWVGVQLAEVIHERVVASVCVDAPIAVDGRTLGKAAIRRDFADGSLRRQIVWGRSARRDDADLMEYGQVILDDLAEQVGLD